MYYTNNEIVEVVYRKYKVKTLIVKMIRESVNDESCNDLEQYIYLELLEMENRKLNDLYRNNKLRNYISNIIKNQRNLNKYSIYRTEFQFRNNPGITEDLQISDEVEDNRLDYVYKELDRIEDLWHATGLTETLKQSIISFSIYKYYIINNISQRELFKRIWWIDRMKIIELLKHAKNELLEGYGKFNNSYESL
jgi:hypothetical protein